MNKINEKFYQHKDVVYLAQALIGKVLVTCFDSILTSGMIVETEAYAGAGDKASHAYENRRTARTEIMYAPGGTAYIYLCYGIHHLFNVVTHREGIPHAVLIRAVEPLEGIEQMLQRRNKPAPDYSLTRGPGSLSKALGLHKSQSGTSLCNSNTIWIEDRQILVGPVLSGPRIGVGYAGEDALLPYRFWLKDNRYVSK